MSGSRVSVTMSGAIPPHAGDLGARPVEREHVHVSITRKMQSCVQSYTRAHGDGTHHVNDGNGNTNGCGVTGKGGHEFKSQPDRLETAHVHMQSIHMRMCATCVFSVTLPRLQTCIRDLSAGRCMFATCISFVCTNTGIVYMHGKEI